MHLKHIVELQKIIHDEDIELLHPIDVRLVVAKIIAQPETCLERIGPVEKVVLFMVDARAVHDICRLELQMGQNLLAEIDRYEVGDIIGERLAAKIIDTADTLYRNTQEFEEPVRRYLTFMTTMGIGLAIASGALVLLAVVLASRNLNLTLDGLHGEIKRRKELESQLRDLALHDALTGLPNRTHFFQWAEKEQKRAERNGRPVCFAMMDLDRFKAVNDRYGHAAGDTALVHAADLLKSTRREGIDLVARLGGEEFCAMLPESDLEAARQMAERVRRTMEQSPVSHEGETFALSASIGVTQLLPGESIANALQRADEALYDAKRGGRNKVVVKTPPPVIAEIKPKPRSLADKDRDGA